MKHFKTMLAAVLLGAIVGLALQKEVHAPLTDIVNELKALRAEVARCH